MSIDLLTSHEETYVETRRDRALHDADELGKELERVYDNNYRENRANIAAEQALEIGGSTEEIAQAAARIALGLEPIRQEGEQ